MRECPTDARSYHAPTIRKHTKRRSIEFKAGVLTGSMWQRSDFIVTGGSCCSFWNELSESSFERSGDVRGSGSQHRRQGVMLKDSTRHVSIHETAVCVGMMVEAEAALLTGSLQGD